MYGLNVHVQTIIKKFSFRMLSVSLCKKDQCSIGTFLDFMNCIKGALRVSGHTPIHDHEADDPIIAWLGMTTQLETITRAEAPWSVWAVSMSSQL